MVKSHETALRRTLARVSPGTELRTGLERILRGRTGALIVLGFDRSVESLCSGGFDIDTEFTPTKLRELAKMDGAIVCDKDATRILKAGVQLMPDASIRTQESGTRHRSAERTAKQTGVPVISVSQSMSVITIYVADYRYAIDGSQAIMARANQALQTLEHYSNRLEQVLIGERQVRGAPEEALAGRRGLQLEARYVQFERAEMAGIERRLQQAFALGEVFEYRAGLVLAATAAHRRRDQADQRGRMERALDEGHIAERAAEPRRFGAALGPTALAHQHDREVRP